MKLQPDDVLIARFSNGDRKAFEVIYTYYYKYVIGMAVMILDDQHGAKDIASEVFVRLWEHRKKFSNAGSVGKWLLVTSRRASLNERRTRQRRQANEKELPFLWPGEQWPHEYVLIGEEILAELSQQLEALPPRCRDVVELLFFQGCRTAEAALKLGIGRMTVQSHKTNALMKLRAFRQRFVR